MNVAEVIDFPSTSLSKRLSREYGYDEFIIRRWLNFFGENGTLKLIKAMEGVPKYIRVNTIKIREKELIGRLEKRGFVLKKTDVDLCYEVVEECYSIGATPEYLMGYYYVMDKSSCVPPLVLDPEPDDLVVDFAASPGGKTTFIAQLMKNRGRIFAIEVQKDRINALIDNLHRMGVVNTAIVKMDATKFHEMGIEADKILLDAPCTGEGIIHKDPSRRTSRGKEDIIFCSNLQRALMISAIKSLKDDGILVYSTCSMTPEENELAISDLIDYFEDKGVNLRVEKIPYGDGAMILPGMREEVRNARRFYPHIHRCSGFFVAKIRKK